MAFCGKCGTKIEDGVKFCPGCGTSTAVSTQNTAQSDAGTAPVYTAPVVPGTPVMAILAYFGPLVLIPILAAKGSKFARYHSNQGLVLFIACVAYSIAYGILSSIILAISWRLYFITSILSFVGLIFIVLAVIGIINACKGEMKPLPVLGSIKILK